MNEWGWISDDLLVGEILLGVLPGEEEEAQLEEEEEQQDESQVAPGSDVSVEPGVRQLIPDEVGVAGVDRPPVLEVQFVEDGLHRGQQRDGEAQPAPDVLPALAECPQTYKLCMKVRMAA